jgi:hypothetical protein
MGKLLSKVNFILLGICLRGEALPHLMGIDQERSTYRYSGRDFRLTDVVGEVARGIIG